MIDLNQKLTDVKTTVAASVQVTGQKSRDFKLTIDYSQCTIEHLVSKAASHDRIAWQNSNRAKGEQHMADLPYIIEYTSPIPGTRGVVDVEAAYLSKMQSANIQTLDEQVKKLQALKAKK